MSTKEPELIHAFELSQYYLARPLFKKLEAEQPMCTAVLEGIYPGKLFVDDLTAPKTAFLTTFLGSEDESVWGFLAGDPRNDSFNRALNEAIFKRTIISPASPQVFFTCDPSDWGGQTAIITAPYPPISTTRRRYVCRSTQYDWGARLPTGFSIHKLTPQLVDQPNLVVPPEVQQTILKWKAVDHPRFADFGFVAIHTLIDVPVIASWCTVDFVANETGDIGFFTLADYRQRGLAANATAAALEYAFSHGLTTVNWTCAENNTASIRIAEKLGFERKADYRMHLLMLNEPDHWSMLGYVELEKRNYAQAVDALEHAFSLKEEQPEYVFYDAARAYAGANQTEKAFQHLRGALKRGWSNIAALEACQEFNDMQETPEWEELFKTYRLESPLF